MLTVSVTWPPRVASTGLTDSVWAEASALSSTAASRRKNTLKCFIMSAKVQIICLTGTIRSLFFSENHTNKL
jgi:hypothetical protein